MGIEIVKVRDPKVKRGAKDLDEAIGAARKEGPKLLNKRISGVPKDAVYIGRPSRYGNPFPMRSEKDRDKVCDQYDEWIMEDIQERILLRERMKKELEGKDLVCFCVPDRCHGETVMRIANED